MKKLIKDSILRIQQYEPGMPDDVLKGELSLKGEFSKLASNENPLGPSPLAIDAINKSLEDIENLTNKIYSILKTIEKIAEEGDINETKKALYYGGTKYLLYCFDLIKEYLENTSTTIKTIEKL